MLTRTERMDSKTGFRECSRCGLRNKPTAKQCDFCGQKFDAVDDWELQLDALEKLNQETRNVEAAKDVSKKIEATIKKKGPEETAPSLVVEPATAEPAEVKTPEPARSQVAVEPVQAKEPEAVPEPKAETPVVEKSPVVEAAPSPKTEEPTTVITFTAESKPMEVDLETKAPSVEEAPVVKIEKASTEPATAVPEPIAATEEPVKAAEPEPVPKTEKAKARHVHRRAASASGSMFKWKFDAKNKKSVIFMTVLVVGVAIYLASMALSSSLGTIGAWSAAAVSGLMIVIGIAEVAIDWTPAENQGAFERHEIVEICPYCNEQLRPGEDKCPACGIELEPSERP